MDETMRALFEEQADLVQKRWKLTDQIEAVLVRIFDHQESVEQASRPDYKAYLQSDAWRERAREARKAAGHRCQLCNAGGCVLHVHHRTYSRIFHEDLKDLICLCEACHQRFHGITGSEDNKDTLATA